MLFYVCVVGVSVCCTVSCFCIVVCIMVFFFKQKTAYEMRISDWSSDVCSSDLICHKERPFHTVLSCVPAMYDELWTGGKGMYKLEPVEIGRASCRERVCQYV